jgi:hypothetical protein
MATLRNLAVGALHLAGRHDTTEATRWASRNMKPALHHPRTHIMILKRPCKPTFRENHSCLTLVVHTLNKSGCLMCAYIADPQTDTYGAKSHQVRHRPHSGAVVPLTRRESLERLVGSVVFRPLVSPRGQVRKH